MYASFKTGIAVSTISRVLFIQAQAYEKSRITFFLMMQIYFKENNLNT